jgi:Mn2+/Fe2+ NRAMP family transporter
MAVSAGKTAKDLEGGVVEGALGRVDAASLEGRPSLGKRVMAFLAVAGPGLIVMVGDNDAGGVSSYAQAGQNFGASLMWVVALLIPILIVAQEMVVRLGAVTYTGHAALIRERFGRAWAWFSVVDLFLLNFLTLLTEFVGIQLGFSFFGLSRYVTVPLAALGLFLITSSGRLPVWERYVYALIAVSLVEFPLAIMCRPRWGELAQGLFVPGVQGGLSAGAVMMIVALVGTTVAPWQLFFQQSNVVDKRITPRFVGYERADTVVGAFLTNIAAIAIMAAAAFGLRHTPAFGNYTDALGVAKALSRFVSYHAGALFAILLIDAAMLGAVAVTLSSSYAFGDMFGLRHSLNLSFREGRPFYLTFGAQVALAAGLTLIPHFPFGIVTYGVQILAGVLLPSALTFLLLLLNDHELMGPWSNGPWLNLVASTIIYLLTMLSLATTAFSIVPSLSPVGVVVGSAIVSAPFGGFLAWATLRASARRPVPWEARRDREVLRRYRLSWASPSLAALGRIKQGRLVSSVLVALRAYLILASAAVVVEVIRLVVR